MEITHDWDESDPEEMLQTAFTAYHLACYGTRRLSDIQHKEVRQAFLSGIHWLNTQDSYDPVEIEQALRKLLGQEEER